MKPGMKFSFSSEDLVKLRGDILAIPVFEEEPARERAVMTLDKVLGGLVGRLIEEERFKAKKTQSLALHTHGKIGAARLILLGAGARRDFEPAEMRPRRDFDAHR